MVFSMGLKEIEEMKIDWTRDWTESSCVPCGPKAPYPFPFNHIAKLFWGSGGAFPIARLFCERNKKKIMYQIREASVALGLDICQTKLR